MERFNGIPMEIFRLELKQKAGAMVTKAKYNYVAREVLDSSCLGLETVSDTLIIPHFSDHCRAHIVSCHHQVTVE